MIYTIIVKTKRKDDKVEVSSENQHHLIVHTKEGAFENKANKAVITLLSDYFNTSKSNIRIIKGLKSKNKVIEIYE